MTVGKDVSGLFPDVLKNMQTEDLEQKKLVYLYLMNYAKTQPELVILAVNTFVRVRVPFNNRMLVDSPLIHSLGFRRLESSSSCVGDTHHGLPTSREDHRLPIRSVTQGFER